MSGQLHAPAALPTGKVLGAHLVGSWVGPKTALGDVERRKILPLSGLELRPLGWSM
jgi:hypothetical protein